MKSSIKLLALLAGAAIFALAPLAAQTESKPREGGKGGRGRGPTIEMLTERLGLTADQAGKLKPVLEKQRTQMEALRNDDSLSPEDRRAKMRSIRDETDQAISAVLTAEQKKKWDEARANRGPGGPGARKGERPPRT